MKVHNCSFGNRLVLWKELWTRTQGTQTVPVTFWQRLRYWIAKEAL